MMRQLRLFHLETALTHEHERRHRLEWYLRELLFERQTLEVEDVLSAAAETNNALSVASGLDLATRGMATTTLNSYEIGSGMVIASGESSASLLCTSPRKVTVSPAEIFGTAACLGITDASAVEYSQSLAVCAAKLNKKLGSSASNITNTTSTTSLGVKPSIRKAVRNPRSVSVRQMLKKSSFVMRTGQVDSDRFACESDDNENDYEDGNSDAEPIEETASEDEFTCCNTGGSTTDDADDESELSQESCNDDVSNNACGTAGTDLAAIQRWERLLKASQQKDKSPRRKLGSSFDSVGCSSSPLSSSPSSPVTFSFEQPAIEI